MNDSLETSERIGLRPAEVARRTGLSLALIRKEIQAGRLVALRVGRGGRAQVVRIADLEAWLGGQTGGGTR